MSGFGGKAGIPSSYLNVRYWPKADIRIEGRHSPPCLGSQGLRCVGTSPAWGGNKLARKEKSVPVFIFLSLRHRPAFDGSVYPRPRLFQAVDVTVGISGSPAMALQLPGRIWHRQGKFRYP